MYRVKFLQVSTGQMRGLLPLYQLDYRNHHHQLINVHESVTNIFLPIIIFIAIIFRHTYGHHQGYIHHHHPPPYDLNSQHSRYPTSSSPWKSTEVSLTSSRVCMGGDETSDIGFRPRTRGRDCNPSSSSTSSSTPSSCLTLPSLSSSSSIPST